MTNWHKAVPFFQMMKRMRKKEYQLKSVDDLAGFDDLTAEDQATLRQYVSDFHDDDVDWPPAPPKKERKRKASTDEPAEEPAAEAGDAAAAPPAAKSPKQTAAPKTTADLPPIADEVRENVSGKEEMRALAEELVRRCRDRGLDVPSDDDAARKKLGTYIMNAKTGATVDVAAALRTADTEFGLKTTVEVQCAANEGLASAFKELSSYEFKMGDRMKGVAYQKVSAKIAEQTEPITSGKQAAKLPTIGKGSAAKIDEYLQDGAIAKLQEYKNSG